MEKFIIDDEKIILSVYAPGDYLNPILLSIFKGSLEFLLHFKTSNVHITPPR